MRFPHNKILPRKSEPFIVWECSRRGKFLEAKLVVPSADSLTAAPTAASGQTSVHVCALGSRGCWAAGQSPQVHGQGSVFVKVPEEKTMGTFSFQKPVL